MFFFWTLSLMFVLQHCVSSDDAVSLSCNQTVEVTSGGEVTIQCSVNWTIPVVECGNIIFTWVDQNNSDVCRSNICTEEQFTVIRLRMRSVLKEENVTAGVVATCGMDQSKIRVKIIKDTINMPESRSEQPSNLTVLLVPLVLAACVCAVALFFIIKKRYKKPQAGGTGATTNCSEPPGRRNVGVTDFPPPQTSAGSSAPLAVRERTPPGSKVIISKT